MSRTQRVRGSELWPVWKVLLYAALLALVADLNMWLAATMLDDYLRGGGHGWLVPVLFLVIMIGIGFGVPACVAIHYHPRVRHCWQAFLFGAFFGLMTLLYPLAVKGLGFLLGNPVVVGLTLLSMAGFWGLLFAVLWIASRYSRGRLRIIDGARCPDCGYSLLGNTTQVCSECGKPFELSDLEISVADLSAESE